MITQINFKDGSKTYKNSKGKIVTEKIKTISKNLNGKRTKFTLNREDQEYFYVQINDKFSFGYNRFPKSHCKSLKDCVNFFMIHDGNLNKVLKEIRDNKF